MERNLILRSVEPAVRAQFGGAIKPIPLERGQILHSAGSEIDRVYFPLQGLVGIQAETADGTFVESAIVGREGAIGAFEACGSRLGGAETAVQISGHALQISASAYRELFDASPALRTAIHLYVEQLLSQTRQVVVCNTLHSVEARLIRTLLDARDKSGVGDVLPLTQDMLARMLGVQRTTVALVISGLQRRGLLGRRRGAISIADASGLEAISCSCREALRLTIEAIEASDEPACDAVVAA